MTVVCSVVVSTRLGFPVFFLVTGELMVLKYKNEQGHSEGHLGHLSVFSFGVW